MKYIFTMIITLFVMAVQVEAIDQCEKYHNKGAAAYEQGLRAAKNGQLDSTLTYLDRASDYYINAKYECQNGEATYGKPIKQLAKRRSIISNKIKERELKRNIIHEMTVIEQENRIAEYEADMNKTVEIHKKTLDDLITELQDESIDKETFKKGLEPIIKEIMLKSFSTFMSNP